MVGKDLIGRMSLLKKRRDNRSHRFCFLNSKIYTLSGINESCAIIHFVRLQGSIGIYQICNETNGSNHYKHQERSRLEQRKGCIPGNRCAVRQRHIYGSYYIQRHFTFVISTRCSLISFPTVDLSLPIVWAMAVLVELLVIPVRMILRSSKVKCEKAFVVFI